LCDVDATAVSVGGSIGGELTIADTKVDEPRELKENVTQSAEMV